MAVSVTGVPLANEAEQVAPQSIPDGELVTVPEPVPAFDTVSMCVTTAVTVTGAVSPVGTTANWPALAASTVVLRWKARCSGRAC